MGASMAEQETQASKSDLVASRKQIKRMARIAAHLKQGDMTMKDILADLEDSTMKVKE